MTAAETLEYARTSVDQIERGIDFVQDQLAHAESIAIRVDEFAVTAADVAARTRRGSKYVLIVTGVAVVGVAVLIAVRRYRARRPEEASTDTADQESVD